MSGFKVGDAVVCVDGRPEYGIIENAVYTIEDIRAAKRSDGSKGPPTVFLVETGWDSWNGKGGYGLHRFRPVHRTKTGLSIESFLTIKPGQYEEPRRVERVKKGVGV